MEATLAALRAHPRGRAVPSALANDMRRMYDEVFAADKFPAQDLAAAEVDSVVERLGAGDARLAVCARAALRRCGDRGYQQQALARVLLHLAEGRTTAADVVLPTGTGKTYILSPSLLLAAKFSGSLVPCITPSTEIAAQNFEDLCEQALQFDAALEAARLPPVGWQLRWVVTEGQLRQMKQEAADLKQQIREAAAQAEAGEGEPGEEGQLAALRRRRSWLKSVTRGRGPMRAVLPKDFAGNPLPDVVVYNFHKAVLGARAQKRVRGQRATPGGEGGESSSSDDESEAEGMEAARFMPARAIKVVGIDESHRLGTPTIQASLRRWGWPLVLLAGATPLRMDAGHWVIPREVAYHRPKRWFEVQGWIKETALLTFSYPRLDLRVRGEGGEEVEDQLRREGCRTEVEGRCVWRSAGLHPTAERSADSGVVAAPCEFAADEPRFVRALARSWTIVQDGATVVLQRLQILRLASGLPLQAIVVVGSRQLGQRLVAWLRERRFMVSRDGYPRVAMTTSNLSKAEQQAVLQQLRDAELDIVVCVRKLIEGYNNNLLAVLGLLGPLPENYCMQYMGRVVRLLTPSMVQRLEPMRPSRLLHPYFAGWLREAPPVARSAAELRPFQKAVVVSCGDMGMNETLRRGVPQEMVEAVQPPSACEQPAPRPRRQRRRQAGSADDSHSDSDVEGGIHLGGLVVLRGQEVRQEMVAQALSPEAAAHPVTDASILEEAEAAAAATSAAAKPPMRAALRIRMPGDEPPEAAGRAHAAAAAAAAARVAATPSAAQIEEMRQLLSAVWGREATAGEAHQALQRAEHGHAEAAAEDMAALRAQWGA